MALNFTFQASAQKVIDLSIGTTIIDSLIGDGDLHYYKIPVKPGEKIFVLVNKENDFSTVLSLKEGVFPEFLDIPGTIDQGIHIISQSNGYCYAGIQLSRYSWEDPDTCRFTITAHNELTFPRLMPGQTLSNQELNWNGDTKWFQIPVQEAKKILTFIDKKSSFTTQFSIMEDELPYTEFNCLIDSCDQGMEFMPQTSGFCYLSIILFSDEFSTPGPRIFSITAHSESTMPSLSVGQILSGQTLEWNGDKRWYQIRLDSSTPLSVDLLESNNWNGSLAITYNHLKLEEPTTQKGGNENVDFKPLIAFAGIYYVEVKNATNEPTSYSIIANDDLTNAQSITLENNILKAEFSFERNCITDLVFKAGLNEDMVVPQEENYLMDFGKRNPLLKTGWKLQNTAIFDGSVVFTLFHPDGLTNKASLIWDSGQIEIRYDLTANEDVELNNSIARYGYWNPSDSESWAVPEKDGVKSGYFNFEGDFTYVYPSPNQTDWSTPLAGWMAFWNKSFNEVYGFTFSPGIKLQIVASSSMETHYMIPKGSSTIAFHVKSPKPPVPYQSILSIDWGPFLVLPALIPINAEIAPKIVIRNTHLSESSVDSWIKIHTIYEDSINGSILKSGETDTLKYRSWTPTEAAAYVLKYQANTSNMGNSDIKTGMVSVSKGIGPEIHGILPSVALNRSVTIIKVKGKGFVQGTNARLKHNGRSDVIANSVSFSNSDEVEAKFNIDDDFEGNWDFVVSNPDGSYYTFYNGLRTTEFPGQCLKFNKWEKFDVEQNTSVEVGVSVPSGLNNMFVVVKKTTHIGYSGTWDGIIKVIKDGKVLSETCTMDDVNIQFNNPDPGWYTIAINSSDPGEGLINVCSNLDTLTLENWKSDEVLRPYGSDWMQLDVSEEQQNISFKTEGVGVWSTLDIYMGSLNNKPQWQFSNMGFGFNIIGSIKNPKPGRYYLKYTDSGVLTSLNQTRQYMIIASIKPANNPAPIQPVIHGLSTYSAGRGPVTFEVLGQGLDSLSLCALIGPKNDTIEAISTGRNKDTYRNFASFDLTQADTGKYMFYYKNLNSRLSCYAPENVQVREKSRLQLRLSVLTRDNIRIDRYQSVIVRVNNDSNSDALAVPVIVTIPKICYYRINNLGKVDFEEDNSNNPDDLPIGFQSPTDDKLIDIPLIISRVIANSYFEFRFQIRTVDYENVNIEIKVDQPLISSELTTTGGKGPGKSDDCNACYELAMDLLSKAISIIAKDDAVNCAKGAASYLDKWLSGKTSEMTFFSGSQYYAQFWKTALSCLSVAGYAVPASKFFTFFLDFVDFMGTWDKFFNCFNNCKNKEPGYYDEYKKDLPVITSMTPEDKYGIVGYDQGGKSTSTLSHFTNNDDPLLYRIDFWNKETATAPAQEVFIWDTLDTDLNDETLAFTEFGCLRWKIRLDGGQYFNVNIDMRPDMNLIVNAEGKYDIDTREISYVFRSLDPATMELTEDPMAGFLPPIDTSGYQIGWVQYEIEPNKTLTTGTAITNQAWVNFDGVGSTNPAPKDAPWLNTIDAVAPESEVNPMILNKDTDSFIISWGGEDDEGGSGIVSYSIYVSEDNNPFELWKANTDSTSSIFRGLPNHIYRFYSIARDGAGNTEQAPKGYDASILITASEDIIPGNSFGLNLSCRPNPFSDFIEVAYDLPENGRVELRLFDIKGTLVRTLISRNEACGQQSFMLDDGSLPAGIYFMELLFNGTNNNLVQTTKIIHSAY